MKYNLNLINVDRAWLAGIIDCDGSISISKKSGKKSPYYEVVVRVEGYGRNLIREIKKRVKIGFFKGYPRKTPYRKKSKMCYLWSVSCEQALAVLKEIKPYLISKKRQAILAIRLQEQKEKSKHRLHKGNTAPPPLSKNELKFRQWIHQKVGKYNHSHIYS